MPASIAGLSRLLFLFLWWPLMILMKQTRQAVRAFKQSILLRCLWGKLTALACHLIKRDKAEEQT